ncbi:MAG: hypothetical protein HFI73_01170 [Bacilli bacterium]|jgi:hypothetical protein|nr:hypothetical protein [Bacilli bacterium]
MIDLYRKSLNINFHNKIFTIFIANDYKCVFLELDDKGLYHYPLLEDFLCLDEIYNGDESKILYVTKKYRFKRRVKKTILGGLMLLSLRNYPEKNYSEIFLDVKNVKEDLGLDKNNKRLNGGEIYLYNMSDVEKLFDEERVTDLQVHEAIDDNIYIPFRFKVKLHWFLKVYSNTFPNVNLRIFYENVKSLIIEEVANDYFSINGTPGVKGRYLSGLNKFQVTKNYSDSTFYHEVSHLFFSFYREMEDTTLSRLVDSIETPLSEMMTNESASCVVAPRSYQEERDVVNYFRNYIDIDYETYSEEGAFYYKNELKKKYPLVDIEFIFRTLDINERTASDIGEFVCLDETEGFLDELFKVCLKELKNVEEDYYKPFSDFARVLYYTTDMNNYTPNLMYQYLEKYNAKLREKQYTGIYITKEDIEEKLLPYEKVNKLAYIRDEILPLYYDCENYDFSDIYGTLDKFHNGGSKLITFDSDELQYYMHLTAVENFSIIGTAEYWEKIVLESGYLKKSDFKEIPITYGKDILGKEYLDDLSISIGKCSDGSIGYVVKNSQDQKVLYSSTATMTYKSYPIPLKDYLKCYSPREFNELNLEFILNDYYLKMMLLENREVINNLSLNEEELKFIPKINIEGMADSDKGYANYFVEGKSYDGEERIFIDEIPVYYYLNKIRLSDLLDYFGVLDIEKEEITISKEEIKHYYFRYLADSNEKFGYDYQKEDMSATSVYNEYLKETGITLSDEDIEYIYSLTPKKNNVYVVSSYGSHNFINQNEDVIYFNAEGKVCLAIINSNNEYPIEAAYLDILENLFVSDSFTPEEKETLMSVSDFITKNNLTPTSYLLKPKSSFLGFLTEEVKEEILAVYGSEVLDCVNNLGLPLPCYDAETFYKANEKSFVPKLQGNNN